MLSICLDVVYIFAKPVSLPIQLMAPYADNIKRQHLVIYSSFQFLRFEFEQKMEILDGVATADVCMILPFRDYLLTVDFIHINGNK